jgi:hypothetical protein
MIEDGLHSKSKTNMMQILYSANPEMADLPDIRVALKILSSEYQPYACGKIFRAP